MTKINANGNGDYIKETTTRPTSKNKTPKRLPIVQHSEITPNLEADFSLPLNNNVYGRNYKLRFIIPEQKLKAKESFSIKKRTRFFHALIIKINPV